MTIEAFHNLYEMYAKGLEKARMRSDDFVTTLQKLHACVQGKLQGSNTRYEQWTNLEKREDNFNTKDLYFYMKNVVVTPKTLDGQT
jgi:hypothetical protein